MASALVFLPPYGPVSLTRGATAPLPSGIVYEVGRREYAWLPPEERDAHQASLRNFLLAGRGPMLWTLSLQGSQRHLYLWLQDDPGNLQALRDLGAPATALGPEAPPDLHWAIANPALPGWHKGSGRIPTSPHAARPTVGRTAPRAHARFLEAGTGYRQLLGVESYPEHLDELSLERLWSFPHQAIIALRLAPLSAAEARLRLEHRLQHLHASSFLRRQRGRLPDSEAEKAQEDALRLREVIVEGRERLFAAALLVAAEGPDRATCESQAALLRTTFAEMGFLLQVQLGLQAAQQDWLLPEPTLREAPARLLTASALSCLDLTPAAAPATTGDRLGAHLRDGSPVLRDRLHAANPMAVVLGSPGHGKSAFVKAELLRQEPQCLLVVDPEGEYQPVVEHLGGKSTEALPAVAAPLNRLALSLRRLPHEKWPLLLREAAAYAISTAEATALKEPFWLTLDEGHLWLGPSGAEDALVDLAKRARKRGLIVTIISQNVGDFLRSQGGQLILANAGRLTLFHQQPSDLPRLKEVLHLSDRALDFLRGCRPGEALLLDDHGTMPFRLTLDEEVLRLVDTRPAFARSR